MSRLEKPLSEEPRPTRSDERLLARECAAIAQRIASFMSEVAAGEANVSDLIIERMWEFTAFPLVSKHDIEVVLKRAERHPEELV